MKRLLGIAAALLLVVAACGDDDAGTTTTTDGGALSCAKDDLRLVTPGRLTIGTDDPAFPPWFDFDPSSGNGFESAVAYAVAGELGFTAADVDWVVVPFNVSYAPGAKNFDFDINQISITAERAQAVDFSDGYYTVNQAVVAFPDSPIGQATTVADLRGFKFGAQIGTTSLDFINSVIGPTQEPFVYDTTNDAKSALEAGQIDGIVVDLPTAFFISAVEIEGSAVIAQFEADPSSPEQFGMLFEQGNTLRDCVNEALAALESSGGLDAIQQEWLSDDTGAPVIRP